MDSVIDDMISQGEDKITDQQIVERIGQMTGLGSQKMTKEEVVKSD